MQYNKLDINKLQKYNRLTILSENIEKTLLNKYKHRYVNTLCDCGNKKIILLGHIRSGKIKSCGCFQKENIIKIHQTHCESKTNLHKRWANIKTRCFNLKNKNYKNYGGRGITMCDEWKNDYTKFRDWSLSNGYKPELQIDRINNDGNYEPSNCRWVTNLENSRNKRSSFIITYKGKSKNLVDWAKILKIEKRTLWNRIKKRNWNIEKAFETPVKKYYN